MQSSNTPFETDSNYPSDNEAHSSPHLPRNMQSSNTRSETDWGYPSDDDAMYPVPRPVYKSHAAWVARKGFPADFLDSICEDDSLMYPSVTLFFPSTSIHSEPSGPQTVHDSPPTTVHNLPDEDRTIKGTPDNMRNQQNESNASNAGSPDKGTAEDMPVTPTSELAKG